MGGAAGSVSALQNSEQKGVASAQFKKGSFIEAEEAAVIAATSVRLALWPTFYRTAPLGLMHVLSQE